ncbi:MAG: ATP-binding cassette domain-containing protein [Thermoprotei archaeon]|nr:ATP-binding cassette domain-containing protein [Thermoprotei archaeon]
MSQASLSVSGITVEVDGTIVVKKANLDVRSGEIAILMGPNGSGKTSLLRAIMGFPSYKIIAGNIYLDSLDVTNLPSWERAKAGIAIANQAPPALSLKTKWLFQKIAEKYGTQEELGKVVNEIMLQHLLERPAFNGFSGGEVKRAEIATVMLSKPKVALLDEPDSGVDVESTKKIANMIDAMAKKGVAILLVTHAGMLVRNLKMLGRGYVMINGRISQGSNARDLLKSVLEEGYRNFRGSDIQ